MPKIGRVETTEASPGSLIPGTLAEQLRYQPSPIDMAHQLSGDCAESLEPERDLVSRSRVLVEPAGSGTMPVEPSGQNSTAAGAQRESARERRSRELDLLKRQGVPVVAVSKWQLRIGPLCIWPYSGRWLNKATDSRGKLKSISMQDLIVREVPEIQISSLAAPKRAYGDCKTNDAEADCLRALKRFVAEAQEFCETLHRFRQGDQSAADQLELCVRRDRENEAYATYRRARKRLLKSAGLGFISETG